MRLHHVLFLSVAACGTPDGLDGDVPADVEVVATEVRPGTLAVTPVAVAVDGAALGGNLGAVLPDHASATAVLGGQAPRESLQRWLVVYRPSTRLPRGTVTLEGAEPSASGETLTVLATVRCDDGAPDTLAVGSMVALSSMPRALRFVVTEDCGERPRLPRSVAR